MSKHSKWYLGRATMRDGTYQMIESVNGGPFRTIEGCAKSIAWKKKSPFVIYVDVVELTVQPLEVRRL